MDKTFEENKKVKAMAKKLTENLHIMYKNINFLKVNFKEPIFNEDVEVLYQKTQISV